MPNYLPQEKKDPYQDLYKNNEKYSYSTNKGGKIQRFGLKGSASVTLKRKTLWGYVKTDSNTYFYLFKTIPLSQNIYGINFHEVHKWFFRIILILIGLTTANEVIKRWQKANGEVLG